MGDDEIPVLLEEKNTVKLAGRTVSQEYVEGEMGVKLQSDEVGIDADEFGTVKESVLMAVVVVISLELLLRLVVLPGNLENQDWLLVSLLLVWVRETTVDVMVVESQVGLGVPPVVDASLDVCTDVIVSFG